MAGFTNAYSQTLLDYAMPTSGAGDHIAYSTNGTSECALARTPVGATGWAAATAADPSIKANNGSLTSAAAAGALVVTHFAVYSAVTSGVQKTDWTAMTASRTLAAGDQLVWAIGTCQVTLT